MYKMTIGPDKTKVITNNPDGFQREIKIKGERLEAVENVKYLDKSSLMKDQNPKFFFRIAPTTAVLPRLKLMWRNKIISLISKVKLMRNLILSTFVYVCERWTLTTAIETKDPSPSDEMPQETEYFLQRPHDEREGSKHNSECNLSE